jgi:hypothetical protein
MAMNLQQQQQQWKPTCNAIATAISDGTIAAEIQGIFSLPI